MKKKLHQQQKQHSNNNNEYIGKTNRVQKEQKWDCPIKWTKKSSGRKYVFTWIE